MRKLKNFFVFAVVAIAAVGIGAHKSQLASAPSIEHYIDTSFAELKRNTPDLVNETPAASEIEQNIFDMASAETSGANIESAEGISELYIEEADIIQGDPA